MNPSLLILAGFFFAKCRAGASSDSSRSDDYYDGGIFGSMADTDIMVGSVSFLIVICLVLLVENIFHMLEHIAHDTPFEDMVLAIEKELMIVGTMAFMLKLVITTSDFCLMSGSTLEFADTLVPVTSFIVAFIGVFLIIMSITVCKLWIRAYHLHLFELLDEYMGRRGHWLQVGELSYLPLSTVNMEMEFRIFHSIFCEQYNIQRKAFAFDEYVYLKFEKFLLLVLKIQEINWVIIMVLVCINWLRFYLDWDLHDCVRKHDSSYKCQGEASILNFIYCGCAMFVVTVCLAIASRYYELALMATRGISNSDDYALYLQTFEDAHGEDAPEEQAKLSEADLKLAVQISKSYVDDHKEGRSSYFDPLDLYSNLKESVHGLLGIKAAAPVLPATGDDIVDFAEDILDEIPGLGHAASPAPRGEKLGFVDKKHPKFGGAQAQATGPGADTPLSSPNKSPSRINSGMKPADLLRAETASNFGAMESTMDGSKSPNSPEIPGLSANMKAKARALVKKRVHINKDHTAEVKEEEMPPEVLRSRDDFSPLFWCNKPEWYFFLVQTQVMFIAFYLAMWVCNFLTVSYVIAQGDKSTQIKWVFLSLLPGLLSAVLYMYCVKTAALLRSVVDIGLRRDVGDHRADGGHEVPRGHDEEQDARSPQEMGNPEEELKALFEEIDDNNSNLLSRREFQIFLEALGITFSRKKWSQIFVEIDLNNDDEISFRELFLFLFPDNDSAKLEEARRLARIGLRVRDHAAKMAAKDEQSGRGRSTQYMKEALDRELSKHGETHLRGGAGSSLQHFSLGKQRAGKKDGSGSGSGWLWLWKGGFEGHAGGRGGALACWG